MTVKEKVAKGVSLLNEKYGNEWRAKVDLKRLDMASPWSCILGQPDSDFASHLDSLGVDAVPYGFDVKNDAVGNVGRAFITLEKEWKRVLKEKA